MISKRSVSESLSVRRASRLVSRLACRSRGRININSKGKSLRGLREGDITERFISTFLDARGCEIFETPPLFPRAALSETALDEHHAVSRMPTNCYRIAIWTGGCSDRNRIATQSLVNHRMRQGRVWLATPINTPRHLVPSHIEAAA